MDFYRDYDLHLSEHERSLVCRASAFCDAAFSDSLGRSYAEGEPFDAAWIAAWGAQGLLGLQACRDDGGEEASFICKIRVAQTVAEHSFAAAFALNNLQGSVTKLSRSGTSEQKSHLLEKMRAGAILCAPALSEPAGGSDLSALTTTARKSPGGWIINGEKAWVTNGLLVGCASLLVRVEGKTGADSMASLLVPLHDGAGLRRREIRMPGARSFRLATLTFSDYQVPGWAFFSEAGEAFKASMASVNAARVHVAAMTVASLRAALADAVGYASTRQAFGKPLLAHQGLNWELAEVSVRLEAASALVLRAALTIQEGRPALTIAAQAKKFAVDTAVWGIEQCQRAMGATGASAEHRLAMLLSEVKLAAFADGTQEMLLDRIGKGLPKDYGVASRDGEGGNA